MYSVLIRPYSVKDSADIIKIDMESFESRNPSYDLYIYLAYGSEIFVADLGNFVVGYIVLQHKEEESKILSLAVRKEFRRRGIGSMLLEKAIESSKEKGKKRLLLEVRISNIPAQKLYKKYGFKTINVLPNYYADGEDAYLMCLDLNQL
uniref:Ribosomal-protein-alanine N-acetyltransferase n=1 Tax=Geoglobus ahangari TaxID=113653 RepID=A0A7C4W3V2_9EURY